MWSYDSVFYQISTLGFCGAPTENDGVGEIADAAMPLSKSRITELREPEKLIAENQMTENPITESQPRNVTAVVHGGTIMALLHILAGGNYFDYQVKNGGGYCCKLRLCGEEWKLDSLEEVII